MATILGYVTCSQQRDVKCNPIILVLFCGRHHRLSIDKKKRPRNILTKQKKKQKQNQKETEQ